MTSERNPSGARYTPPGTSDVERVRPRAMAVRVVAGLILVALVLAPLAFLFL